MINDLVLTEEVPDDLEPYFLATALHELAHVLERPWLFRERPEAVPARLTFESLVLARSLTESPPPELDAEFLDHGDRFIRAALHLCHRAARVGEPVAPPLVCAGWRYGMSHASRYLDASGDEPIRMPDARIRDVLDTPPPEPFARLWADDLDHHSLAEMT